MNDSTPFDTIGDEPLEARIVAWVLGEASAFEAAELERLCEESPELLVFRRRMRALHGLLTEAEAAEPDDAWKLPAEKRKALEELFGEETPASPEHDKETQIRRSGRRALLAIAACLMLTLFLGAVFSTGSASIQKARRTKQAAQRWASEDKVNFLPGGGGGGGWGGGAGASESAAPDQVAEGGNFHGAGGRSKGIKDESGRLEKLESGSGIDIVGGSKFQLRESLAGNEENQRQLQDSANDGSKFDGSVTYGAPIVETSPSAAPPAVIESPAATSSPVPSLSPAQPASEDLEERDGLPPLRGMIVDRRQDNNPTRERVSSLVDRMKDLASTERGREIEAVREFRNLTEYEPPKAPQATRAPAQLSEAGPAVSPSKPATGTAGTLADKKSNLAAADSTSRMTLDLDNTVLLPARQRSVAGAKSEVADSDADSPAAGDAVSPSNGTTVDGITADRRQLAIGGVTNGMRMGDQAMDRNNIDAILSNPNRTDSGMASPGQPALPEFANRLETDERKKADLANGPGAGGGAGGSFGLAADGRELEDRNSMAGNRDKEVSLGLEVAKQMQPPAAAPMQSPSEEVRYKIDGPASAPAAADALRTEVVAGNLMLDVDQKSNSLGYFDSTDSAGKLADAPLQQKGGDLTGGQLASQMDQFPDADRYSRNPAAGGEFQASKEQQYGVGGNVPEPAGNPASSDDDMVWSNPRALAKSPGSSQQLSASRSAADKSSLAERELIRRQDAVAEGDRILAEGRDAYSKGDYQKAMDKYSETLKKLPESPMLADRRERYEQHLNDAKIALAMQNRKVGKYDEARSLLQGVISGDPNNSDAKRELDYLEDPIRNNAALTYENKDNVADIRRNLYLAEGNYNLGKFDDAKHGYEDALRIDPYNSAARRGLERIDQAKTDYYRAAYDNTRAELLMQVDKTWELSVPAETAGKKELGEEKPPVAVAKAKPAPAKKSPLESIEEIAASEEAYSTFSLNINDASFQIAKAALDKGERPDPAGIKVEQFYNAVDYGDPAPASNEPVAATIEQSAHPIIPGRNLVRVSLKTAAAGRGASQPLRLTLLVDQSGSMVREDRRTAMSNALQQLGGLLTPNDHITVVGFSRESHLLADNWTGDKAGKLGDLVNQTASEGGTNLEQAINLGEQMAARPHPAGEQNRIVLFTDGAANLGNANPERLAERVKSLRQKGIAFDIAGIGADGVNDRLLSELARNGNGRYYVVGDSKNESFARQLAGAFRPAAENVKVQVHFNPDRVGRYKLIGFEKDRLKTEDFRNDAVDAAELAAEEAGVAIYQVETLPQGSGEIGEVSVRFRDTAKGEMVERKWTMPFESTTQVFDRATPSMQLAGLSMLAAEKLKGGPLADAIDFRQLSGSQSLLKQFYGSSPRVTDMLHVIDLLK